eukprot:916994-Pyramimonas_sp.AAC.1
MYTTCWPLCWPFQNFTFCIANRVSGWSTPHEEVWNGVSEGVSEAVKRGPSGVEERGRRGDRTSGLGPPARKNGARLTRDTRGAPPLPAGNGYRQGESLGGNRITRFTPTWRGFIDQV